MAHTAEVENKSLEGRKFRFLVSSAEEAARVIKEKLGQKAKVLSVKQVHGKGLSRFLSAPQLEVIVVVPKDELEEQTSQVIKDLKASTDSFAEELARSERKKQTQSPFASTEEAIVGEGSFDSEGDTASYDTLAKSDPMVYSRRPYRESPLHSIDSVLMKSGFSKEILAKLKLSPAFPSIENQPLAEGLAEVTHWLQSSYKKVSQVEATDRIVFLGTAGSGKTTALCKFLASHVFIQNKKAQVLKLENDTPNSDDALRVFCDFLNVPFLRDPVDLDDIDPEVPLIIDTPGFSLNDDNEWALIARKLKDLNVDTRVLVLNAAYDTNLIKQIFNLGSRMAASHVAYTHLDELQNYSKLWEFVLNGQLPTLFLSYGQNITSDYTNNVLDFLINKTFPSILVK